MTEENIFDKYLEKNKGGLFKSSRSWLFLFTIVLAVVLLVIVYKTVILGSMSPEEVKNSIEIVWSDTIWVEETTTPQEIKIVPTIKLKVKNIGRRPLQYVDLEAVFEFEESGTVHSDGMAHIFSKPFPPGEISEEIEIKALHGYTATSREAFFQNKEHWKKMYAKIFARSQGSGLVRIGGIYPIKQEIAGFQPGQKDEMPDDYADENTRILARSLHVYHPNSQWIDKAQTANEVIIVPSIAFDVKNVGNTPLENLYFKGVFRFEETGEVLSEGITPAIDEPLAVGENSDTILIKGEFGYSASSKEAFFYNLQKWKAVKVQIFVKSRESDYALLGVFPVKKEIQGVKIQYH